ncbi:cell wall protein DAN4-like [Toxotes jaculatrix]|uniref:cell wall protein DAN4-like n=1 Tax=Toxotes jaculatrix TaxID=941984 RepID=UPI001B3B0298|nr:cell wall protein DAN4-like [Toxotes jaculatrix]
MDGSPLLRAPTRPSLDPETANQLQASSQTLCVTAQPLPTRSEHDGAERRCTNPGTYTCTSTNSSTSTNPSTSTSTNPGTYTCTSTNPGTYTCTSTNSSTSTSTNPSTSTSTNPGTYTCTSTNSSTSTSTNPSTSTSTNPGTYTCTSTNSSTSTSTNPSTSTSTNPGTYTCTYTCTNRTSIYQSIGPLAGRCLSEVRSRGGDGLHLHNTVAPGVPSDREATSRCGGWAASSSRLRPHAEPQSSGLFPSPARQAEAD